MRRFLRWLNAQCSELVLPFLSSRQCINFPTAQSGHSRCIDCHRDLTVPSPPLQLLIDPDRARRPSAAELLVHPGLQPANCRSRAQLRRQLNAERLENQLLRSQLADLSGTHCSPERSGGGRLVGRGTPRSRSTTF